MPPGMGGTASPEPESRNAPAPVALLRELTVQRAGLPGAPIPATPRVLGRPLPDSGFRHVHAYDSGVDHVVLGPLDWIAYIVKGRLVKCRLDVGIYDGLFQTAPPASPGAAGPSGVGAARRVSGDEAPQSPLPPAPFLGERSWDGPSGGFVKLAAMASEVVAVGADGALYRWKWESEDESGRGLHPLCEALGVWVPGGAAGERVADVSACTVRCTVLSTTGKCATFYDEAVRSLASGELASLGVLERLEHGFGFSPLRGPHHQGTPAKPTADPFRADPAVSVSTSVTATFAVTRSGRMFRWGFFGACAPVEAAGDDKKKAKAADKDKDADKGKGSKDAAGPSSPPAKALPKRGDRVFNRKLLDDLAQNVLALCAALAPTGDAERLPGDYAVGRLEEKVLQGKPAAQREIVVLDSPLAPSKHGEFRAVAAPGQLIPLAVPSGSLPRPLGVIVGIDGANAIVRLDAEKTADGTPTEDEYRVLELSSLAACDASASGVSADALGDVVRRFGQCVTEPAGMEIDDGIAAVCVTCSFPDLHVLARAKAAAQGDSAAGDAAVARTNDLFYCRMSHDEWKKDAESKGVQPATQQPDSGFQCLVCAEKFASRNRLFAHLRARGHEVGTTQKAGRFSGLGIAPPPAAVASFRVLADPREKGAALLVDSASYVYPLSPAGMNTPETVFTLRGVPDDCKPDSKAVESLAAPLSSPRVTFLTTGTSVRGPYKLRVYRMLVGYLGDDQRAMSTPDAAIAALIARGVLPLGRNVLHVCTAAEQLTAVRAAVGEPRFEAMLRERDWRGDTPLSLAVKEQRLGVASHLLFVLPKGPDATRAGAKDASAVADPFGVCEAFIRLVGKHGDGGESAAPSTQPSAGAASGATGAAAQGDDARGASEFAVRDWAAAADQLSVLGAAKVSADKAVLVPSSRNKVGAVWRRSRVQVAAGFETTFTFAIQNAAFQPADGFAFVIQNVGSQRLGEGAQQLGYGGIPMSLAIEFDVYANDDLEDPLLPHVSVQTRWEADNQAHHRYSLGCCENPPPITEGNTHACTIKYSPARNNIEIYIDSTSILSVELGPNKSLRNICDANGEAFVGFTAATSQLAAVFHVGEWSYKADVRPEKPVLRALLDKGAFAELEAIDFATLPLTAVATIADGAQANVPGTLLGAIPAVRDFMASSSASSLTLDSLVPVSVLSEVLALVAPGKSVSGVLAETAAQKGLEVPSVEGPLPLAAIFRPEVAARALSRMWQDGLRTRMIAWIGAARPELFAASSPSLGLSPFLECLRTGRYHMADCILKSVAPARRDLADTLLAARDAAGQTVLHAIAGRPAAGAAPTGQAAQAAGKGSVLPPAPPNDVELARIRSLVEDFFVVCAASRPEMLWARDSQGKTAVSLAVASGNYTVAATILSAALKHQAEAERRAREAVASGVAPSTPVTPIPAQFWEEMLCKSEYPAFGPTDASGSPDKSKKTGICLLHRIVVEASRGQHGPANYWKSLAQTETMHDGIPLALALNNCTSVMSGRQYPTQRYFTCIDCRPPVEGEVILAACEACIAVCHRGHKIGKEHYAGFFCDCGAGELKVTCCVNKLSDLIVGDTKRHLEGPVHEQKIELIRVAAECAARHVPAALADLSRGVTPLGAALYAGRYAEAHALLSVAVPLAAADAATGEHSHAAGCCNGTHANSSKSSLRRADSFDGGLDGGWDSGDEKKKGAQVTVPEVPPRDAESLSLFVRACARRAGECASEVRRALVACDPRGNTALHYAAVMLARRDKEARAIHGLLPYAGGKEVATDDAVAGTGAQRGPLSLLPLLSSVARMAMMPNATQEMPLTLYVRGLSRLQGPPPPPSAADEDAQQSAQRGDEHDEALARRHASLLNPELLSWESVRAVLLVGTDDVPRGVECPTDPWDHDRIARLDSFVATLLSLRPPLSLVCSKVLRVLASACAAERAQAGGSSRPPAGAGWTAADIVRRFVRSCARVFVLRCLSPESAADGIVPDPRQAAVIAAYRQNASLVWLTFPDTAIVALAEAAAALFAPVATGTVEAFPGFDSSGNDPLEARRWAGSNHAATWVRPPDAAGASSTEGGASSASGGAGAEGGDARRPSQRRAFQPKDYDWAVPSTDSDRHAAADIARMFGRVVREIADLACMLQARDGGHGAAVEVLRGTLAGPTRWLSVAMDALESRLRFGGRLPMPGPIPSMSAYVLSLLRGRSREHGDTRPSVSVGSMGHVGFVLDAFLYCMRLHPQLLCEEKDEETEAARAAASSAALLTPTRATSDGQKGKGKERLDASPRPFLAHPQHQHGTPLSKHDSFFRKSHSISPYLSSGDDIDMPIYEAPLRQALPLALNPTLLSEGAVGVPLLQSGNTPPSEAPADVRLFADSVLGAHAGGTRGAAATWGPLADKGYEDVTERWWLALRLMGRSLFGAMCLERDSFVVSAVDFDTKAAHFRTQMDTLRRRASNEVDLSRIVRPDIVRTSFKQLDAHFTRLARSQSSDGGGGAWGAGSVVVRFMDEPGGGSGVTRGWFTALAEALTSTGRLGPEPAGGAAAPAASGPGPTPPPPPPVMGGGGGAGGAGHAAHELDAFSWPAPLLFEPGPAGFFAPRYHPCMARFGGKEGGKDKEVSEEARRLRTLYVCIGRFIGLALSEQLILPLALSRPVVKFLMGRRLFSHDLAFYSPTKYESLRHLLVMSPEELAGCNLTFVAPRSAEEGGGEVGLLDGGGGEDVPVTADNVHEYVKRHARFIMVDNVLPALEALRDGFQQIIPASVLSYITPEEFHLLLNGCGWEVDVNKLKQCTQFTNDNTSAEDTAAMEGWFWEIMKEFEGEERNRFLYFTTGSTRMAADASRFSLKVHVVPCTNTNSSRTCGRGRCIHLPTAAACFMRLNVPVYAAKDVFKDKLLYAINNCVTYQLH